MSSLRLAERVAEAWYGSGRPGSDDAVAVGVVAGLCLLVRPSATGPEADAAAAMVAEAADEQIAGLLAQAWAAFWVARPDLAFRCGCFGAWLDAEPRDPATVRAAAQVARAAIKAGLWSGRFADEDVIGTVYTGLRPDSAKQARGEFYTPPPVTHMMGAMSLAGAEPGQSICDPCAGTGGMFLGAARALRQQGQDPASFWWYGNDISPVSVAGLCVNAHIWALGPQVVIGCADALAELDWPARAWEQQQAAVVQHAAMVRAARMLAVLRRPGDRPGPASQAPPAAAITDRGPAGGPADPALLIAAWCGRCGGPHDIQDCPRAAGPATPPKRPRTSVAPRPEPEPGEPLTLF